MSKITIVAVALFLALTLVYSCTKCPTSDQLQGTWYEQTDNATKTKLIFQGNLMIYFHSPKIDTLSYSLDSKHKTIYMTVYPNPTKVTPMGYTIEYHKRKKVLTITGFLPNSSGSTPIAYYKQ